MNLLTIVGASIVWLYLLWALVVYINKLAKRFSLNWELLPVSVFDIVLKASVVGIIIARVLWLILNWGIVKQVGFWIFPYIKLSGKAYWFSLYPWRALIFWEGFYVSVMLTWIIFVVSLRVVLPGLKIAYKVYKSPDYVLHKIDVFKIVFISAALIIFPMLWWLI